jgi:hypothetical protein
MHMPVKHENAEQAAAAPPETEQTMNGINKRSRLASGVVALLNLVALVSPIRADALDMAYGDP